MTWGEFKTKVEKLGVQDTSAIEFVDAVGGYVVIEVAETDIWLTEAADRATIILGEPAPA